jgi:hypothetical protein
VTVSAEQVQTYLSKWQPRLRLQDWDIRLHLVETPWRKTGDIKIDSDDRKAVLMINAYNPRQENLEEVVIHELLHVKLWNLDQMLEHLLVNVFGEDDADPRRDFAMTQFMTTLEATVEDLTKGYLELGGDDTRLSFGRIGAQVEAELTPPAPTT